MLGRARRLGLPVLPGLVIPAECSIGALARAAEAFGSGGPGAARLAVMDVPLDDSLARELASRTGGLGDSIVVRSSSPIEGEGRWAGAFTSYVGITPQQIGVAVRGCWASAYSRDVLERCEHEGIDPASLRLAVLIQPAIDFESGGTARVDKDGLVHVTATRGSPAQLMTGWEPGEEIMVDPRSTVPAFGARVVGGEGVVAVADLARRVQSLLGDDLIEWGAAPQFGVLLLQSKRTAPATPALSIDAPAAAVDSPEGIAAIRLARLVRRFPGWLGEEVVLPWAMLVADRDLPEDVEPLHVDPLDARDEARALARRLTATAWSMPGEKAYRTALQTIEAVRASRASERDLARIVQGVRVDAKQAARLIGLLRAAERPGAPARDRWEPFLFTTIHAYGERRTASAVIEGIGAGRARYVDAPEAAPPEFDRKVLIVPRPLAAFAPLLWNAAGLVSIAGGAGAHLMEIARSLAVPTVMRCRLDDCIERGAENFMLAVDGNQGSVALLPLRG